MHDRPWKEDQEKANIEAKLHTLISKVRGACMFSLIDDDLHEWHERYLTAHPDKIGRP